jgi:hypothetical protein
MIDKAIRIIKRTFILILLSASFSIISYGQDTVKTYIAYDVFKALVNEHSITIGQSLGLRHRVTFSLAYVYDNKTLRENLVGLSPSQDKYPVMVYKGPAVRAGYAFMVSRYFYVGIDIYAKHLYYHDHDFMDQDRKDHGVVYNRSEHSNFFGGHVNLGFLLTIPHTPVVINPSIAMGETLEYRNHTTRNVHGDEMYDGQWPEEGTFSVKQEVFSIMMNMNIGIRIGK